jgi:hypothetical protein
MEPRNQCMSWAEGTQPTVRSASRTARQPVSTSRYSGGSAQVMGADTAVNDHVFAGARLIGTDVTRVRGARQ